jgi:type I restriction enzyme R subunit
MYKEIAESDVEKAALGYLEELGWNVKAGPEIAPDGDFPERDAYQEVVLKEYLRAAIKRLNPELPEEVREVALSEVTQAESPSLIENNRLFHRRLTGGFYVSYQDEEGKPQDKRVKLVDWEEPGVNDWLAVNQFTVEENRETRRPDIVTFVNGLPLGVFELKNMADEKKTVDRAYQQIQTYKDEISSLFRFNTVNLISDGKYARVGSLTAPREWFIPWRTVEGDDQAPEGSLEMKTAIKGIFEKRRFLDLVRNFVAFKEEENGTNKILAAYHQFHAARTAVEQAVEASRSDGDQRAGVVWHTQGSGKSLTMTFFAGKLIQRKEMKNPTLVVLTDRNDLDDQLFGTFSQCSELLRNTPEQADSRDDLRDLLNRASGGVIFTTIQKFFPENGDRHPQLSDRRNIVVIADEAHRSQYGFIDGFARHMHDALPNATFIGFTGTPIDLQDRSTKAVFGDYISIYDIEQSIEDNTTVPIYYESRLAKLDLASEIEEQLDEEFEVATEGVGEPKKEELKSKWSTLEKLVGTDDRLDIVAKDLVSHFERRLESLEGKAMVVCMSRRICVKMYDAITELRPDWHSSETNKGEIKVVMSGSASDDAKLQPHIHNKAERDSIKARFKDPDDELKMVIVCDMWLTGFDAPPVHTMYIDKPMKGHGLMQAIARVNRVHKDKPGGLIVDYIGIAKSLRGALKTYTEAGGKGQPQLNIEKAVEVMRKQYEKARDMLHGFDYDPIIEGQVETPVEFIHDAAEYVRGLENGRKRFKTIVSDLSKVYSIAGTTDEAEAIHDEVAFFQQVRGVLAKTDPEQQREEKDVDHAVKQLVSRAVASDEVIDILESAGLEKPDISVLSDEFLQEVSEMKQKNLAVDMLEKVLKREIKESGTSNVVQSRKFSELLEKSIQRYQNRSIEAAQVIEELLDIAKDLREIDSRADELDMSEDELAFYDALADNESAREVLGDDTLRTMAHELTRAVRRNVTIDWTLKESARAKLRSLVKRLLKKYGYPPDDRPEATETVVEQAEMFGNDWVEETLEEQEEETEPPVDILDEDEARPYENSVPLVDLEIAAGEFSEAQSVEEFGQKLMFSSDVEWVELPDRYEPKEDYFVAQVVGESMNKRIPDGAYCLFEANPAGSRQGKVVLAQHRDIQDPELGGNYTVKVYKSEKEHRDDGSWRHSEIRLEPDTTEDHFEPIVIEDAVPGEFRVIAELQSVLSGQSEK